MGAPDVSVVIPTRNREMRLRFVLEALAAQRLAHERFEVIVVRAADAAEPPGDAPSSLRIRFLTHPPGPAAQRNAGWRAAAGRLVAFVDDDCRPAPGWLEALLAAGADGETIVQGVTLPDPDEVHLLHGQARSIEVRGPSERFETCNIAYPRVLLERAGGFDERFPSAWGEDMDLGLRACELGAGHRFVPQALAYHAVHPRTLRQALREAWQRDSLPMVVARHPDARRQLFLGIFTRRSHAKLLLALAGMTLARRAPLVAGVAVAPYLGERRISIRPLAATLPKALVRLPARALVDSVAIVAVARAALRNRVLVL